MVRRLFVGLALAFVIAAPARSQEWTFYGTEKLPSSINSGAEESMPLLTPDASTLYFTRILHDENVGGPFAGQDIWVGHHDGRTWKTSKQGIEGISNNRNNNAIVGMSADGSVVYFIDASPYKKIRGIYFSKRAGNKWTSPELIPIEGISSEGFVGLHVTPDSNVILISMKGDDSLGEEDLYVCLKDKSGTWSKPRNLGPSINTSGFEMSPFLSADKKTLFFSSNGHNSLGDADIFYAERLYDSWETWSTPRNLGETINTRYFEGHFALYGDTVAYFTSNRDGGLADIYAARVTHTAANTTYELSADEIQEIFGVNFSPMLTFQGNDSELMAAHKELLWYIGNKLIGKQPIKVMLQVPSGKDETILQRRASAIMVQLALSGLEGSRILPPDYKTPNTSLEGEQIKLIFIR